MEDNDFYGREKIAKILFKITPPVMLAQLIQALYNIVDSLERILLTAPWILSRIISTIYIPLIFG